jgi:hypothetical protein
MAVVVTAAVVASVVVVMAVVVVSVAAVMAVVVASVAVVTVVAAVALHPGLDPSRGSESSDSNPCP